MTAVVISVKEITKTYNLYAAPLDRVKELLHPLRKKYHKPFQVLKPFSLEICKGEALGIVGRNGAGKSTLLKILAGVLSPTSGSYEVRGNCFSMLELGTGFNLECTGIENIFFSGALFGFTKKEMQGHLKTIQEFADIGDFIYQPLKKYSNGMRIRLAMSLAMIIKPDILLADEIFAVGDSVFRTKCVEWIKSLCAAGVTLVLVSHDFGVLNSFCTKGLLLDKGSIVYSGSMRETLDAYLRLLSIGPGRTFDKDSKNSLLPLSNENIAQIEAVDFFDGLGNPVKEVCFGQEIHCMFKVKVHQNIKKIVFMLIVRDKNGYDIASLDSYGVQPQAILESLYAGEVYNFSFCFQANFLEGTYSFLIGIGDPDRSMVKEQSYFLYDLIVLYSAFNVSPREGVPLRAAMLLNARDFVCSKL